MRKRKRTKNEKANSYRYSDKIMFLCLNSTNLLTQTTLSCTMPMIARPAGPPLTCATCRWGLKGYSANTPLNIDLSSSRFSKNNKGTVRCDSPKFYLFFLNIKLKSICEKIIAANMRAHPTSSRPDIIWLRTIAPAIVATTDSKLMISEATVEDDENF